MEVATEPTRTVACIGGVNIDIKAVSRSGTVPGTSNPGTIHRSVGGVAANVATNLARLGVGSTLFSAVGDDDAASVVIDGLRAAGVGLSGLSERTGARTAGYVAALDADGELVVAVADMQVIDDLDAAWVDDVAHMLRSREVWVVDANLSPAALDQLFAARPADVTVFADPVSAPKSHRLVPHLAAIDVVFPDAAEAGAMTGVDVTDNASAAVAARQMRDAGARGVVLKLGARGVHVVAAARDEPVEPRPHGRAVDVTGAGDALIAGYVAGLLHGGDPVTWGLAAAGITVETPSTTHPDLSVALIASRL